MLSHTLVLVQQMHVSEVPFSLNLIYNFANCNYILTVIENWQYNCKPARLAHPEACYPVHSVWDKYGAFYFKAFVG